MKKKIFALILCLTMVMSLLPTWAFAAEAESTAEETTETWSITGIVIANERFCLDTDENGDPLNFVETYIDARGNQQTRDVFLSYVTDKGESLIYYTGRTASGDTYIDTIVIDRALDDDMLGTKVTVTFTGEKFENSVDEYKNIKVVGDVIVHEDTVVYTVPAMNTDIYPNGESTSSTAIRPYIGFMADGEEHKIEMSTDVAKYPKNIDAQRNAVAAAEISRELNQFAYVLDDYSIGADDAWLYRHQDEYDYNSGMYYDSASDTEFISDMGIPTLAQYRFVSVDGGETYSYMFKMVDDFDASGARGNIAYGFVSAYNRAVGTIRFGGINGLTGTYDLGSEVVVNGKVSVDDAVVVYRENGKLVVEPVEVFNAAVEEFTDYGVKLNGKEYFAWFDCEIAWEYASLADFYRDNTKALKSDTKYYTYNNLILEIEFDDSLSGNPSDYAVILQSYYDANMETAHVKLGFADNTEGTYKVGKLFVKNASNPQDPRNDRAMDFNLNAYVGMVVSYKILDNGTVDLSGQYFKDEMVLKNYADGSNIVGYYDENGNYQVISGAEKQVEIGVVDGKISFEREVQGLDAVSNGLVSGSFSNTYYPHSDDTIVFAIYGSPGYNADGSVDVNNPYGYLPLKARAFKISELVDMCNKGIDNLYVNVGGNGMIANEGIGHVLLNSNTAANKYVVAASMSVGASTAGIQYLQTDSLAYVVAAEQKYNATTKKYYAELTLINEKGLIKATTVENVKDLSGASVLWSDEVGPIDGPDDEFPSGSFVRFGTNDEGKIDVLEPNYNEVKTTLNSYYPQGLYLVNITQNRNGVISFYDTDADVETEWEASSSLEMHENGCHIIGIDGNEYAGEKLTYVSKYAKTLPALEGGNAVIEVNEGQITRIFSFTPNYVVDGDLADFDEIEEATEGDLTWNFTFGAVTYCSEEKDIIRIEGADPVQGTYKLSDLVIKGDVSTDTLVVCYKEGESCVVEAAETVTGEIEDFVGAGAVIGGNTYYLWPETFYYSSFFEFCNDERAFLESKVKYYTYGNMILDIEVEETTEPVSRYAVVLRSYYDADLDKAYVKLGFADGTEGMYKVGKLYTPKSSDLTAAANNLPQELANNSIFGIVVKYAILDDGTLDLSGQDFEDIFAGEYDSKTKLIGGYWGDANAAGIVRDGKFQGKYAYNDDSIIFALYGNPGMVTNGTSVEINAANAAYYVPSYNGKYIWDATFYGYRLADTFNGEVGTHDMVAYAPVKAKAFKLSELKNLDANAIQNLLIGDYTSGGVYVSGCDRGSGVNGSYILDTTRNANNYIVAAAVTVGYDLAQAEAAFDHNAKMGYVVSAEQCYNISTRSFYAKLTIISEDGKIFAKTVDDVKDDRGVSMLDPDDGVGKLDGRWLNSYGNPVHNWTGLFVRYELDDDGVITMLATDDDWGCYIVEENGIHYNWNGRAVQGLYRVNLAGVRGNVVSFYDFYVEEGTGLTLDDYATSKLEYAENGCSIIGIDDENYVGEVLTFIPSRQQYLPARLGGNAVIYVNEDGEIEKIFSFGQDEYATISYDLNGGEGELAGFTKRTGTDVALSETVPTRENHIFLGWAESADATEAVYQPGDIYAGDANAVLYAVWKLTRLPGDANGDEEADFIDAMLVLKHDAGIEELTGDNLLAADANGDGETDFVDALLILQYDAGLVKEFK